MKPKVLVVVAPGAPSPQELAALAEVAEPVYVATPEEYLAARAEAHVMFVWDLSTRLIRECGPGDLEWIQTNSIGVNAVATSQVAASGVVVTNTRGVFETPMAEFVLAGILFHVKRMRRSVEDQRRAQWNQRSTAGLAGRHAVIIGAGGVGRRVASLLGSTGIHTTLVGRTRRSVGQSGETVLIHGIEELYELLPQADDVVLATPLTDSTRHMVGKAELEAMRRGAHIVNVGRGQLIDEAALVAALRSGQVGGATLDVFEREPLPPDSPLWAMENVFISAHQSGDLIGWRSTAVELFLRNLSRWQRGLPLADPVDLSALVLDSPQS